MTNAVFQETSTAVRASVRLLAQRASRLPGRHTCTPLKIAPIVCSNRSVDLDLEKRHGLRVQSTQAQHRVSQGRINACWRCARLQILQNGVELTPPGFKLASTLLPTFTARERVLSV